ncbi:MAG TPA: tRNA lysidine(34) synthetase TilS [Gemmatimonadaceae bacterium]|nr:tRNA lysidine(34) synthetase TilS [Gemmatimonadaceae bacterium]
MLAVSGGRDSMVLLDAAAHVALSRPLPVIATFDHGTGAAASRAVELVARESAVRGLACVIGHAGPGLRREAEWREARWQFLREVAAIERRRIATAHTRDDQVETAMIRVLRGAGARGLAGLYARSDILRPLLELSRAEVASYAAARSVSHMEDPSNQSRRHLRNRLRLDLLPAIRSVDPDFEAAMLGIARRATRWREELAAVVDQFGVEQLDARTIRIAAATLQGYDGVSLRILWPEVAARAGVTMDRRGTERAAAFTIDVLASGNGRAAANRSGVGAGGRGRVIQLSGGAEIRHVTGAFVLRRR